MTSSSNTLNTFSLLLVFLILGSPLHAQEETIRQEFTDYFDLIRNQEVEKAMDYIPGEFFDIFPREAMVSAMKMVYNTPGLEVEFGPMEITHVSSPKLMEDKWYAMMNHISEIKMKFDTPEDSTSTTEDKKMYQEMLMTNFEQQFGEGNVSYDTETQFYLIKANKQAVAVSPDGQTDWKFVVAEKKQLPILRRFLPAELMEELEN
ncbi:MAG: hypothetical protein AAF655_11440 [Bacteroidota bacterium]